MIHPLTAALASNPYGGCFLSAAALQTITATEFELWLNLQLPQLRLQYKLFWLELPVAAANLLPLLLQSGFEYHHCHPTQLMLVLKLQADSYLPLAATHSVGVGAAVFNRKGEILLVRELALAGQKPGYFKLPGGMVEPKEHLALTAQREVFEETGVQAEFKGLFGMRHHHQGQFGASNLYVICKMSAITEQINRDPNEIADAAWFEPAEFLTDPQASLYNQHLVRAALAATIWSSQKIAGYLSAPELYEIFSPEQ